MEKEGNRRNDVFLKHFKPSLFHKTITEFFHCGLGVSQFILTSIHEFIRSERFKGSKLLEIGSGPGVHNIASASARFPNIVLSEYVDDNCEELERWLDGKSILDWSPFLNFVAELEGCSNDLAQGRGMIEARIRKNVKAVVHCDLLSESVLQLDTLTTPETSPPYDLVISSMCVCVAAESLDDYVAMLRRIGKFLRKGGGLILTGYLNGSQWLCGGCFFPRLKMDFDDYVRAFERAGFGNLEFKVQSRPDVDFYYRYDKVLCIAAEKL